MTALLEPMRTGRLARRNPVAKLLAALIPAVALIATLDPVTPAVILALLLLAVPFTGVDGRSLLRRSRPLLLAALMVGLVNAVFGRTDTGLLLLELGPLSVTSGGAMTGLGIALRVLGVALPGVLVLAATDPVDLADSLVQQLRVPPKFAYGTLAALRLLPLLGEEWQTIAMARRARGFDAGRSPVAAVRLFASQVLALLVVAIRRGTRLATAMDARGFDSGVPRTYARTQVLTAADLGLVAMAVAASTLAVRVSVGIGAWRPLFGA
ncbi:MAG: cobalt transporter [Frankiales bacterium]|nr:cobalt transporter [Frankiales bacterium]